MKENLIRRVPDKALLGLSSYFARVYNYMAGGLLVSAICGYLVTKEPFLNLFYNQTAQGGYTLSLLGLISIFAPLILIFMIQSSLNHMNIAKAQVLFWVFSALMGLSLSNVFLAFTSTSVFQAFLTTACVFFGMSIYGYTTKRFLMGMGSFLMMGLIGVIIAMIVNIFLGSAALSFGISVIAVFIFVLLTAYDTQKLKLMYSVANTPDEQQAVAISGALSLYLDFINLFQLLISFMGERR